MIENRFRYASQMHKKDNSGNFTIDAEIKIEEKNPLAAYIGSEQLRMVREQEKEGRLPAALFTDIDNTFYRKDRDWPSKVLFRDLQRENYPVVAVTGNGFSGIEKRIQTGELPYFPIIAGLVGTEIYVLHEENGKKIYKKDEFYEEMLNKKEFNRLELAKKAQQMIDDLGGKNLECQNCHPEWQLDFQQPEKERECLEKNMECGTRFKLSFYAFASSDISIEEIKTEISKRFPGKCAVYCEEINYNSKMGEGDYNKKYCIDILPITKAEVVEYIADKSGVAFKVVAGDSGNDTEMIMGDKGNVSVVVGGAKPELLNIVDKKILDNKINKDIEIIRDNEGKIKKIYYREIGTSRGPESISKVFKMLKNMQQF